jgi:hypothetical protein
VVEETDQIEQHIAEEREKLGRNFDEIEKRIQDATDLKAHFDRNISWVLGAAVAGGFLLSLTMAKSSANAGKTEATAGNTDRQAILKEHNAKIPSYSKRFFLPHLNRVSETVDDIFTGLVGVFSDKLQSFVADAVPGFQEQYDSLKRDDQFSRRHVGSTLER